MTRRNTRTPQQDHTVAKLRVQNAVDYTLCRTVHQHWHMWNNTSYAPCGTVLERFSSSQIRFRDTAKRLCLPTVERASAGATTEGSRLSSACNYRDGICGMNVRPAEIARDIVCHELDELVRLMSLRILVIISGISGRMSLRRSSGGWWVTRGSHSPRIGDQ